MKAFIGVVRGLVGLTWLTQIVLGILFWTGNARNLVSLHMNLGYTFVAGIWLLSLLCWRAGAPGMLAVVSIVWGFVVMALGMTQTTLLPGSSHWIVQVTHLLVAIVAMALVGRLSSRVPGMAGPKGQAFGGHGLHPHHGVPTPRTR